jgi:tellurite resistance protein TehA-like permease
MNKGQKITTWGILIALIGLLGLEAWTLLNKEDNDTISEVIQNKSRDWLMIPFGFGFLMGHWFWNLDARRNHARKRVRKEAQEVK